MKKLLFQKVFEKARKLSGKTTKNGLSDYLSDKITDDFKYSIAGKTFVRYYEKYIEENGDTGNDPKTDLLDALSKYLGYKNFGDFVKYTGEDDEGKSRVKIILKKNKIVIIMCLVIIAAMIFIFSLNKQRWMVWEGDHYIEVPFDTEKYRLSELKLYSAERIANFKQVIPDCKTKFFNEDGSANLWYGKSANGELEYFTTLGKHPETGKTLKEITPYMINKYICKEW